MKKIKNIILIIFLFLFLYSFTNIIIYLKDSYQTKTFVKEINKLKEDKNVSSKEEILVNPVEDENDIYWDLVTYDFLNVNLENYLKKNSDTIAWLEVNGTNINYPITQTTDNKYYLKRSFDKSSNKAGWVFSDYRNNFEELNYNSIIYGHKRKDKTMFGTLDFLLKDDWFKEKEHYLIKLETKNTNYLWQIFSVYTIYQESYYIKTNFINKEEYQNFLEVIKKRNIVNIDSKVNNLDKILTLSTCLDNNGNRIVVHAKLIKKEIIN